jgi:hypothetical protein
MTELRLSHLVLQTGQLSAMREWYLRVLGAHVIYVAADPVGPTFDAQALADAFDAGVPVAELTTRRWAARSPQADAFLLLTT